MSFFRPSAANREIARFWTANAQALAVVVSVVGIAISYTNHASDVQRESKKPFNEKKLEFYSEAGRVLAHLAMTPDVDGTETRARFWELFLGELPMVETSEVRKLMEEFCAMQFRVGDTADPLCSKGSLTNQALKAKELAEQASEEIRKDWVLLERHWYCLWLCASIDRSSAKKEEAKKAK